MFNHIILFTSQFSNHDGYRARLQLTSRTRRKDNHGWNILYAAA